MTNATLRGKPDAGNPHVRFDEGEVASTKPRRGSLLSNIEHVFCVSLLVLGGTVWGADYTWLAQPVNGDWLGTANWNLGTWSADAANTASFNASSISDINVNGTVALKQITVYADTTFTNGTLALNGPFSVDSGVTATVDTAILQTDTGTTNTRFDKAGPGTLVLTGTNQFYRLRTSNGTLHFKGGQHDVVGVNSSPAEGNIILSLAKGNVLVDDGAVVTVTNASPYFSNSGAAVVISNATMKISPTAEFLNGFADNNGSLSSTVSSITVESNGVFSAGKFRFSKGTTDNANYGLLRVNRGGTVKIREFSMDADAKRFTGSLLFDGGTWEASTDGASAETKTFYRLGGGVGVNSNWIGVKIALGEGGLTYFNRSNTWIFKTIEGAGEHDGGVRFTGYGCTYWYGTNTYTGCNILEPDAENTVLALGRDRALGAEPSAPTTNVIFQKNAMLHFGENMTLHPNRILFVPSNRVATIGTMGDKTARIRSTFEAGGTNGIVKICDWWNGWTEFCPDADRTNTFLRLQVYAPLRIGSGTTLATQKCGGNIDASCPLFIKGTNGKLTVTGGVLRVTSGSLYAIVSGQGQVNVIGGLLDTTSINEYINGLGSIGHTTISGTGELRAQAVRISQCSDSDATTGLPVTDVNVCTGGVLRLGNFYIDENASMRGCLNLNGGTVVARWSNSNFLGTKGNAQSAKWTNILVRVCAGGAIFDTEQYNVTSHCPFHSGAAADGGLTKKGTGTFTLVSTNGYNGATRVEGGKLVFSHADGYPGGHLDFPGATLQAKNESTELVNLQTLTFRAGCKVRVPGASALDERTFGKKKVVAKMATALTELPELVFLNDDGTEAPTRAWKLFLEDGGKTLAFGCSRGTVMILR